MSFMLGAFVMLLGIYAGRAIATENIEYVTDEIATLFKNDKTIEIGVNVLELKLGALSERLAVWATEKKENV
jgi:hypothetical protein